MQTNENLPSLKDDIYGWIKETVLDPGFNLDECLRDNDYFEIGIAVLGDEALHGIYMARDMLSKLDSYVDLELEEDLGNMGDVDDDVDLEGQWDLLDKVASEISEELNQEITQETGLELSIGFGSSDQGDYLVTMVLGKDDGAKIIKKVKKLIAEGKFPEN